MTRRFHEIHSTRDLELGLKNLILDSGMSSRSTGKLETGFPSAARQDLAGIPAIGIRRWGKIFLGWLATWRGCTWRTPTPIFGGYPIAISILYDQHLTEQI